jgi:hypothetical protein
LERIEGWIWDLREYDWQENYQRLIEFTTENGHARPPQDYPILGKWVSRQRDRYKRELLEKERILLLEKLEGWIWSAKQHC